MLIPHTRIRAAHNTDVNDIKYESGPYETVKDFTGTETL